MTKLTPGQHIHLVGIGGSGLSAIARILLGQGYRISGSDRSLNELTEALARDGATIYGGHDVAQVNGADALIITSAVKDDHVEVAAARARGIPVYKRQDIIADLMVGKLVIAVAGTKGKTTTTSMIVHILRECGADPSYIVGGVLGNTGTNAGVGKGHIFVIEADEYDNMFLGLRPNVVVLTNVEYDHPDFFTTHADMIASFRQFIGQFRLDWFFACADDSVAYQLAQELKGTTYGLGDKADIRAYNVHMDANGYTHFEAGRNTPPGGIRAPIQIALAGLHNVRNALAALLAASVTGYRQPSENMSVELQLAPLLATFKPTARRFDLRADVNHIAIIDDYAHNPTSIRVTIEAARQRYPDRAIWAVWQPHTYSRTQALMDDFLKAFDEADHVLVTDIYAAREAPIPGITSAAFTAALAQRHSDARHTPTFAAAVAALRARVQPPAVVLIMSAGDAPQIGVEYLKVLESHWAQG
jgi:UDP-N-acetylmuramate--alanine ligase